MATATEHKSANQAPPSEFHVQVAEPEPDTGIQRVKITADCYVSSVDELREMLTNLAARVAHDVEAGVWRNTEPKDDDDVREQEARESNGRLDPDALVDEVIRKLEERNKQRRRSRGATDDEQARQEQAIDETLLNPEESIDDLRRVRRNSPGKTAPITDAVAGRNAPLNPHATIPINPAYPH